MKEIQAYLDNIIQEHQTGRAREHSYRPALKTLLEAINSNILATNEPSREKCGAPDFIITDTKNIPRGYIEAKDITLNILDDKKNQAQIQKYFDGELGYNFIHTDNLEFRFYRNAELVESVRIADNINNQIIAKPEQFEKLELLLQNFLQFKTQTITSSKKLSEIMAGKARMIKRVIYMALKNNQDAQTEIHNQFDIFRKILVHDLDETSFADIYAQTITYGLFTARLHDPTLPTFDRDEAAQLLPKSNPFLKKFFQSLRDDLDPRIEWIVDDLVEIFLACDVKKLLEGYGKTSARNDPIIHFYEDFLASYDPKLRKAKGVYYTPEPVVNFMIRGVDHILQTDFGLSDGVADTSKIEIEVDSQEVNKRTGKLKKMKKQVHKVQILDPATGTGTFLNDIIKYIYESRFKGMSGIWNSYVDENLLPRLHGFEIMMASYAMAHLKLDLTLRETGYHNPNQERLGIYLTNALEQQHEDAETLFASFLSNESNQASYIKKNMPIMTIIGNPPYSVSSSNKGEYILNLLQDYKKDLNERNIQPLSDDYIKFIRYSSSLIEKNGEGILCFISNNSYLDGITHRQMRKHILETFDTVYIYDLHGNARKKETSPDGSVDQNVFDIMAGVNIIFAIKNTSSKKLGKVLHYDSFGKRQDKYDRLNDSNIDSIDWKELPLKEPYYFFVPKDFEAEKEYNKGVAVNAIFDINTSGIQTHRDHFVISDSESELKLRLKDFYNFQGPELLSKYKLKENSNFNYENIINKSEYNDHSIVKYGYKPFDIRHIYYSSLFIDRDRMNVMKHMLKPNIGFTLRKTSENTNKWGHIFVGNNLSDKNYLSAQTYFIPLYLYNQKPENLLDNETPPERVPNFDMEVIAEIEKKLKMKLVVENEVGKADLMSLQDRQKNNLFTPEDLFDYIYSVLHSKSYRETFKEFLKIDFPKIPFNYGSKQFFELSGLGKKLRILHLMEDENLIPKNFITEYPIDGNNEVGKIMFVKKCEDNANEENDTDYKNLNTINLGRVYINDGQYFDGVPEEVFNFYIGGYQPAQKWLKDRKGKELNYEDILHYSKIILVLKETTILMDEIEKILIFN